MEQRLIRLTILFALFMGCLTLAGYFIPNVFTWGFHFLGFLPPYVLLTYSGFVFAGVWYAARGGLDQHVNRLSQYMEAKPGSFLAIVVGVFVAFSILLRIQVPLLGDSFIAVKIYENTFHGSHPLPASHQPLALLYFYYWIKFLGQYSFPEIMNAFLVGELFLGAAFIVIAFYSVKHLADTPQARCCSFLLLLTLPCMQIFFGYVELYAAVLCVLSLYVLVTVLFFKQKIPFYVLPAVYLLLVLAHYLNALLLPSLLYAAYHEFRQNRFKHFPLSIVMIVIAAGAAWAVAGFDITKFIPPPRSTPLLSVVPDNDIYQAYTLFSPFHFIDLANAALLLIPSGLFLLFLTLRHDKRLLIATPVNLFFVIAIIPLFAFFAVAKFDLPLAQDWDVVSSYSYLFVLFAALVTLQWLKSDFSRVFGIIAVVTFSSSLLYFYLNASTGPNIDRVKEFVDTRVSSHDGCYQSTLHLTEYFIHEQDQKNIIKVSEKFIGLFPGDKRGYSNYTLYLMQFGKSTDKKISDLFEQWMVIDSTGTQARKQYADFLLDIGNRSYHEGVFSEARTRLKQALVLNPNLPEAYNSLGIIWRKMGNNDSAIACYRKTIELDPKSVYACINLGNAYDDKNNADTAIAWYRRAINLQPDNGMTYFNMGCSQLKKGEEREAIETFKQAARLKNPEAQQLLRQRGEKW